MKKEWKKPELEELDVKMTMLGSTGTKLDNDFPAGTEFDDITLS
ncbi:paeninodin family lasso peptide [Aquibacillus albus]|uniref:Paeninodin family lasso peptide n=1 Tax=Aquibacillus albus TaxID=1168171 RepID=A0ABS2N6H8_9BACI|nr:paeninodin family lasso peptide [Aquibacillus albus]MBM7573495.1 hypothetical protein [Aquibacillus albus]